MKHEFDCTVCHKHIIHEDRLTTGYGTNGNGDKVCFQCCADLDMEYMRDHGVIDLYLITEFDGRPKFGKAKVTNWPGTLEFSASVKVGRHNIAGVRYDCWFVFDGYVWHGVTYGDNTQICHCKRTKEKR